MKKAKKATLSVSRVKYRFLHVEHPHRDLEGTFGCFALTGLPIKEVAGARVEMSGWPSVSLFMACC
jgi:hypothetical protein